MVDRIFKERIQGVGDRLFNNPLTRLNSDGIRYRTTRMELPSWVDRDIMTEGVDSFDTSIDFEINRISSARPVEVLKDSPIFPEIRKEFRARNVIDDIREKAPEDGEEIVGWMQNTAADAAVLTSWADAYGENSSVDVATGDPTAPHDIIGVSDYNFEPTPGRSVSSSGSATFRTPDGEVEIANNDSRLVASEDSMGWGSVKADDSYQWEGKVAQFKDVAKTPIENPVQFPEVGGGGGKVPNIINQSPPGSSEQAQVSFNVSANEQKKVDFKFRNPNNYAEVISENTFTVPEGTSNVQFNVSSTPAVPPLVAEMKPKSNTQSVESYTVQTI